ncbi:FAD-binding and (Fe-S)-binding domain-containing protein [Rugamonas sp. DEMB1]|uniref:FAD-binding and (Fe-S)-binding domain-containing protein n=1 Tax=Rugamonas sp. DEMB1 TaxID=3039386 RepID=UPI0024474513|nr:FAD-binding and (Fe-S)-binding domain-containing protein [Rugamonas sp. DEMB1]WGG52448.1 FAD-binding and (Fe-S)-binding domain-containing protein [Rugamonas sp. DEMB1]
MKALIAAIARILPAKQVVTDPLRRLAYGTDASFYRMTPAVVAVVESEQQVQALLALAREHRQPVTFRAAGTSLSGQAVTDSVLALIGEGFANCDVAPHGATVRCGPGMVGAAVNARLAPFGRKIGPDPASINTCKIGGIAANNASGMCCGTAQNSYQTLAGMRVVLADGTLLDTEDAASVASFRLSHSALLAELAALADATRADPALAARIAHKYKIKNTTGYSLNALLDYRDPVDILAHLMIGSEGTLGFISQITYNTVVEDPYKASALVFFADIDAACQAVIRLKPQPVAAVELLDRAALRSVQETPGLPAVMRTLGPDAAALLIEVRADTAAGLQQRIALALGAMAEIATLEPAAFSTDADTCAMYWKVRKGTFPSVGAVRAAGTTVIIEDVAFPIESLAAATLDLQAMLLRHGYSEAIIFGHALEGNLHFVFTQDFASDEQVQRYARLMDEVCLLVVDKYDGSLKAEHGTGRNMAPFVEKEWGKDATELMRRIKRAFDPLKLLNPGVILNDDPQAHLRHLKPMPAAEPGIDRCIECGFCEPMCPSHQLTLSPRQRIASWREMSARALAGLDDEGMRDAFDYQGIDTCAGCSLCATACPVGIDTGGLIRLLRGRAQGPVARQLGSWSADHPAAVAGLSRAALKVGRVAAGVLGETVLSRLSGGAWKRGMPRAGTTPPPPRPPQPQLQSQQPPRQAAGGGDPVVYFPACGGRIFGANQGGEPGLAEVIMTLLARAGYAVRLPERVDTLCCGQMLSSKGMDEDAKRMSDAVCAALLKAADDGNGGYHPVIMDASSCSARMHAQLAGRLRLLDFHEFAHDALLPRLRITRSAEPIALHINCSVRGAQADGKLRRLVAACTEQMIEPDGVLCCGFGGDRGFVVPELNAHALRKVHAALPSSCCQGVSTNRTCEIGLTAETGRNYRSVAYLLEECSRGDGKELC